MLNGDPPATTQILRLRRFAPALRITSIYDLRSTTYEMLEERLQKLISRAGLASRRQAEKWIEAGEVTVNGKVATLGDKADLARDAVKARGRLLEPVTEHRSYLLNKPAGTISTRKDPEGRPTVYDCLPAALRSGLFTIGRLDWDTEGAMVLTSDGDLAQRVAHPRYGGAKRYEVKVKGVPGREQLDKLRAGINLHGKRTLPAKIRPHRAGGERPSTANSWWKVELKEGRTRQIREMFQRVDHPVLKLRRVAIGGLALGSLTPGEWRELNEHDLALLTRGMKPIGKRSPRGR